jgi:hypothetical protein
MLRACPSGPLRWRAITRASDQASFEATGDEIHPTKVLLSVRMRCDSFDSDNARKTRAANF